MGKYAKFFKTAIGSVDYWTQVAIDQFVVDLVARMDRLGMKKVDLAKKIGTSQAYVTNVIRGNANFTLETMTKLAMAVGGKASVRIVDRLAIDMSVKPLTLHVISMGSQVVVNESKPLALECGDAANEFSYVGAGNKPRLVQPVVVGAA